MVQIFKLTLHELLWHKWLLKVGTNQSEHVLFLGGSEFVENQKIKFSVLFSDLHVIVRFYLLLSYLLSYFGEWPGGLMRCNQNLKASSANPTRRSVVFRKPNVFTRLLVTFLSKLLKHARLSLTEWPKVGRVLVRQLKKILLIRLVSGPKGLDSEQTSGLDKGMDIWILRRIIY